MKTMIGIVFGLLLMACGQAAVEAQTTNCTPIGNQVYCQTYGGYNPPDSGNAGSSFVDSYLRSREQSNQEDMLRLLQQQQQQQPMQHPLQDPVRQLEIRRACLADTRATNGDYETWQACMVGYGYSFPAPGQPNPDLAWFDAQRQLLQKQQEDRERTANARCREATTVGNRVDLDKFYACMERVAP